MPAANKRSPSASSKKKKSDEEPTILKGVYMFPNGDKYDGEYSTGPDGSLERCGPGTHTSACGVVYEGAWSADKLNGHGRITYPSGAAYEGGFCNNMFQGQGKYTWPNGACYEGMFSENKMEGDGQFTDTETQQWTGTFRYKAAPGLRFKLGV